MKLRTYSMASLEAQPDSGPVYVINRTSGEKRGDVFLTVARKHGIGNDSVHIPLTWIPVDLTAVVNRRQLIEDNNFRQAITSGMLQLIHPDDAVKLYETDAAARAEFSRIASYLLRGGMSDGNAVELDDGSVTLEREPLQEKETETEQEDDPIPTYITAFLQDVQHSVESDAFNEDTELAFSNRLRNFGTLPKPVLKHIYKAVKPHSKLLASTARGMANE